MKLKIKLKILLLLSVLFFSTSFRSLHPIKLTSSLIEYNPKTTSLIMECRVFIDDFEHSINKTLATKINLSNLTKEDKKGIEDYFERYYKVTINDKRFPFKYKSSTVMKEHNVLSVKFSKDVPVIKKGDQICIENTLFYEDFGFLQSNRITVRIPPFITENYFEVSSLDKPIPLNL